MVRSYGVPVLRVNMVIDSSKEEYGSVSCTCLFNNPQASGLSNVQVRKL